jgi:hypothetical protein
MKSLIASVILLIMSVSCFAEPATNASKPTGSGVLAALSSQLDTKPSDFTPRGDKIAQCRRPGPCPNARNCCCNTPGACDCGCDQNGCGSCGVRHGAR